MKRLTAGIVIVCILTVTYISIPIFLISDNPVSEYYRSHRGQFSTVENYATYPIYELLSNSQFLSKHYCAFSDNFCQQGVMRLHISIHDLSFPNLDASNDYSCGFYMNLETSELENIDGFKNFEAIREKSEMKNP